MTLVSIPANPVPDNAVAGMLKTQDGVRLRFARFAPPPGRKGTVCIFPGPRRIHREIFRDRARPARARLRGRDARLARAGRFATRCCAIRSRAMCEISPNTRPTSKPSCARSCCRIARRRITPSRIRWARACCCGCRYKGQRWFDRMVMSAPMIGLSTKTYPRFARPAMKIDAHVRHGLRPISRAATPP